MKEERVVGPGILDQPVHCTENVLFCGLAHGVLLIIGQDDHVFSLVTKLLHQVGRHVPDIVDAASQLTALAEVVDANQQRFSTASAVGVSERIACWCAVAKALRPIRRGRRIAAGASLIIAIRGSRTGGRHACFIMSAHGFELEDSRSPYQGVRCSWAEEVAGRSCCIAAVEGHAVEDEVATFIIGCKQLQNPGHLGVLFDMRLGEGASAIPDMRTAVAEEHGNRSRAGEKVDALGEDSRCCKRAAEAWRETGGVSINV